MSLKGLLTSISFPALAFVALPAFLQADTVTLITRETVKGEIAKETFRGLQIGAKNIDRAQVAPDGISYDRMPETLDEAQKALKEGDYRKAHRGFQTVIQLYSPALGGKEEKGNGKPKAKPDPKKTAAPIAGLRPIFLQHALYGEVQAFVLEGNAAGALAAIKDLLDKFKDTWFLQEVLLLKVRLAGAGGEAAAIEEVKKHAADVGAGPDILDRIELIRAENLKKQKKDKDAEKIYKDLARSSVKAVAEAAKLAVAKENLSQNPVQARIDFLDLLRSSKDRSVLCGAARGLGDVQMKEMKGGPNPEGLREALESYLKAVLLYFPAPGDPTEAHQAALESAAKCAEELSKIYEKQAKGESEKKGDPKKAAESKTQKMAEEFRNVARDNYRDLQAAYPRSEAAKKVPEALRRLSSREAQPQ